MAGNEPAAKALGVLPTIGTGGKIIGPTHTLVALILAIALPVVLFLVLPVPANVAIAVFGLPIFTVLAVWLWLPLYTRLAGKAAPESK